MSIRDFLTSSTVILLAIAVAAVIEIALPLFATAPAAREHRGANLGLTALTLVFNWALTWSAALVALAWPGQQPGMMTRLGLPVLAEVAIGIAVLDFFFGYVSHRLMHSLPALWRVHRVHHSDPFVDATTAFRTHPIEVAWRFLCMMIPAWVLGIRADTILVYRLLSAINAVLEHGNIRVRPSLDGAVSLFWVTPNMHKVHHSRDATETDTNYGNLVSLYDRMLRTFTPTDRAPSVVYGLDDADPAPSSISALLAMPFRPSSPPTLQGGNEPENRIAPSYRLASPNPFGDHQ